MVRSPAVDSTDYDEDIVDAELEAEFIEDSPEAEPKHGTSVPAGWGAADKFLDKKASGEYATDFKFSDTQRLVRFLQNEPFSVYEQHWLDKEGKRSYVCLGEDCPLCDVLGDKPRAKFAFNVLVLSDEETTVQILTAPPTLARQLRAANDDPRRGPLDKYFWAISRQGSGPQTTYSLERVRASELAEEWDLDPEEVADKVADATLYGPETVYVTPKSELLAIARALASN